MLTIGSLCSGIGGLELGIERALGARTVWQAELDRHASTVLAHHWPGIPNHGDLTATDWAQVEPVDVMCFGFPCQDISQAGRRAGIEGAKSALWFACADAVRALRPRHLLVENVAALLVRGFDVVLADLAEMGYMGRWGCLRSSTYGAPHRRERVFLAATDTSSPRTGRDARGLPRPAPSDRRPGADVRPAVDGGAAPTHPGGTTRGTLGDAQPGDGQAPDARRGTPQPGGRRSAPPDPAHWGDYAGAVTRWAAIHGPPPQPRDDRGRLNPQLPEWMLGYPAGWVTDIPIPRTAQLRVLGNSVQPQVAEAAARLLLAPLLNLDARGAA